MVTENAGKWSNVEATRDVMTWTDLDTLYRYCKRNGLVFKHHCFVWGQSQPSWITNLSAAEQREEVEEWIRLFCERYPDVRYIDVVNEPVNAPAPYRAALGGNGTTGWDWVVWVFEKARQYAPQAKLILNEYDVLKGDDINSYLQVINVLKARNLLDAIGEQAHFLEGTSQTTIKTNLKRLTDTGIPVYITELDLQDTDNAKQNALYQKVFPLFWETTQIKGVTLWGYKKGTMWRKDGWLVDSSFVERPAMKWLRGYVNGRTSDTLQAEQNDGQNGGVVPSSVISNTDNGDWIKFNKVNLANKNTITMRYAMGGGGGDGNTVEVRADSLSGTLIATLVSTNTGSWNTYTLKSATVSNSPGGTRTVYFVFKGGNGIGNFDWFRFTGPAATATTYETEDLVTTASGASQADFAYAPLSQGKGNLLSADGVGDWVEYDLNLPAAGTYNIKVGYKTYSGRGTYQLNLSQPNVNVGSVTDQYASGEAAAEVDHGNYSFTASGTKKFRFIVQGKNTASTGYTLAFDYIKLTPASNGRLAADLVQGNAEQEVVEGALTVYPNPTTNQVTASYWNAREGTAHVMLRDIQGRSVLSRMSNVKAGHNQETVDVSQLASGWYLLRIVTADQAVTRKVLVQH